MVKLLYLEASGTVYGPLTHEQLVEMYFAARLPITTAVSKQANGPFTELYKSTLLIEFALSLPQWYWCTPLHSVGPVSGIQLYSHLLNGTSQIDGEVFHAFFTRGVWVATADCVAFCRGNVNNGIHQQLGSSGVNDLEQYQNSGNELDEQPAHKAAADRTKILLDRAHTSVQKDRKRQSAAGIRKISLLTICIGLMVVLFFVGKNVVEERFGGTNPKSSGSSLASNTIFNSKFKSELTKEDRDKYLKLVKENREADDLVLILNDTVQILNLTKKYIQHRPPLESRSEMKDFTSLRINGAMTLMCRDMLAIAEELIGFDTVPFQRLRSQGIELGIRESKNSEKEDEMSKRIDQLDIRTEEMDFLLNITKVVMVEYCDVKTAELPSKNSEEEAWFGVKELHCFNSLLQAGVKDDKTQLMVTQIRQRINAATQSRKMAIKFFEHFLP
jgi:hypothetical protein